VRLDSGVKAGAVRTRSRLEGRIRVVTRGVIGVDSGQAFLLALLGVVGVGLLARGGGQGGAGAAVGRVVGEAAGAAVGSVVGGAASAAVQHPVGTAALAAGAYALGRSRPPSGGAGNSALARRARAAARRSRQAAAHRLRAARGDLNDLLTALRSGAMTRAEAVGLLGAGGIAAVLAAAPAAAALLAA
jgi:hypothetical protein